MHPFTDAGEMTAFIRGWDQVPHIRFDPESGWAYNWVTKDQWLASVPFTALRFPG